MSTVAAPEPVVTGGVDTHLDLHVAAALDGIGGVLGTASFPTTAAGYRRLLAWLRSFGTVGRVGVEGTGSYGAALARHLTAEGVRRRWPATLVAAATAAEHAAVAPRARTALTQPGACVALHLRVVFPKTGESCASTTPSAQRAPRAAPPS